MITGELEEALGDPGALLQLASDTYVVEREAGCHKLVLAAAWADVHGAPAGLELAGDAVIDAQSVLLDRFVRLGPLGTPLVRESCAAEFGNALQAGPVAARKLIRVALTVRYRLPRLWARVKAGEVWLWKVRHIAEASAHLSPVTSSALDARISRYVETLAWTRFLEVFDAALLHVDEATYLRRADEAAGQRDVRSYRGQHGLRTLVAKAQAGDVAAFEALVARVAECLAEDGDEDLVAVRRSKAIGIIAHPARLRDLLARHADQAHDPRHPDQRVAAHQADPDDPWAADGLPPAGWESDRHGNYHQPGPADPDDLADCWADQTAPGPEPSVDDPADHPVGEADRARNDRHRDQQTAAADHDDDDRVADDRAGADGHAADDRSGPADRSGADGRASADDRAAADRAGTMAVPAAFDRSSGRDQRGGCLRCGSVFDLQPLSPTELAACRTKVVVHVHVTDTTLIDQHGVLRTADGPITLDQFRRWLSDTDPTISIRPVLDPADIAAVDSYEIPLAIREAIHTRHPGSIWPFSPVTEISIGGRLDLDHNLPYQPDGPPRQTGIDTLGPLARSEHRPKTIANWQVRQPAPGIYIWRSPHGIISVVTNQGTLGLGNNSYTHALWQTAQPQPVTAGTGDVASTVVP